MKGRIFMKLIKYYTLLLIIITLMCSVSTISAVSDDIMGNITADDSISIADDAAGDESNFALTTQNEYADSINKSSQSNENPQLSSISNKEENISYNENTAIVSVCDDKVLKDSIIIFNGETFSELENQINKSNDGDVIYLNNNITQDTTDQMNITKSITIDGNGYVIDAKKISGIFKIYADNVVLQNIICINTKTSGIYWTGKNGQIVNCTFINNTATFGGAIYWEGEEGIVSDCTFINNTVSFTRGSAIYWRGTNGVVSNSKFINNYAQGRLISGGGAICWDGMNGVVSNSSFINNCADFTGGAIYWKGDNGELLNCNLTKSIADNGGAILWAGMNGIMSNCNLTSNVAYNGGAICWRGTGGVVSNCNLTDNIADSGSGGAIYWEGLSGIVSNCSLTDNEAYFLNGGAIYWKGANGIVSNCNLTDNVVLNGNNIGGAIYWDGPRGILLNCNLIGNVADYGGAIYWNGVDGFVSYCNFIDNSAQSNNGGAIYWSRLNGAIYNSSFISNTAGYSGGAVFIFAANNIIFNCSFFDNTAIMGGVIYCYGDYCFISNCNLTDNSAMYGGAIYCSGNYVTLSNSSLTNNIAELGGAVFCTGDYGKVYNCNLTNNGATDGGAVYLLCDNENITNCNFRNNIALDHGGSIYLEENSYTTISNSNFIDSETGNDGGAIFGMFIEVCNINNCNFSGNDAEMGGALVIYGNSDVVANCNFVDNNAEQHGGAIRWNGKNGIVSGCNFSNNNANSTGGSIYWDNENGNVLNCIFINNTSFFGGAIYLVGANDRVSNCSLIANVAENGGAIYWQGDNCVVNNCLLTDNIANEKGGAIYLDVVYGVVSNSVFENNSATQGGAIYSGFTVNITNAIFLLNKAQSSTLSFKDTNYTLMFVFEGEENYINAIYSTDKVIFNNVTYWNGEITNIIPESESIKEAGQNITIEIYDFNGNLVENITQMTDYSGQLQFNYTKFKAGNYTFKAYHADDNYYTYINTSGEFSLNKFDIIVLNNETIVLDDFGVIILNGTIIDQQNNNTLKTENIKLMFVLSNGTEIEANYKEGIYSAEYRFDNIGKYLISAKINGEKFIIDGKEYLLGNIFDSTLIAIDGSIIAENMKRGWKSPYDYQVKLVNNNGNPIEGATITFTVNGKDYNVTTDSEGIAKLTTSKLNVGTYNITVSNPVTGEIIKKELTIVARILENKDLTKDYESSKQFTVRAIGDDGNPVGAGEVVKISVNGKTYSCKTDKNGYATLKIHLTPKTYTITASYKDYVVKNKVKVKQTLKLVKKTVTVKKGKKLVLKAKLKWSSGKAIKGKKIVFKFQGKKYTAKTNSKGIAKVTIKSKVTKKLKKGKKYNYSAKYLTNAVKGKVKVVK